MVSAFLQLKRAPNAPVSTIRSICEIPALRIKKRIPVPQSGFGELDLAHVLQGNEHRLPPSPSGLQEPA